MRAIVVLSRAALTTLVLTAGASAATVQDDLYGSDTAAPVTGFSGLRGSLAFSSSIHTTLPTTPPADLRGSFGTGGGGSAYVGARLPYGFHVELEGLFRQLPISSAAFNGASVSAKGYGEMFAPIVNVLWEAPLRLPVHPYIGAGIGYGWTETSLHGLGGISVTPLHSDGWRPVYDVMAGFAVPVTDVARFTAGWRWLRQNAGFPCGTATHCRADFENQSIDLGLEVDL